MHIFTNIKSKQKFDKTNILIQRIKSWFPFSLIWLNNDGWLDWKKEIKLVGVEPTWRKELIEDSVPGAPWRSSSPSLLGGARIVKEFSQDFFSTPSLQTASTLRWFQTFQRARNTGEMQQSNKTDAQRNTFYDNAWDCVHWAAPCITNNKYFFWSHPHFPFLLSHPHFPFLFISPTFPILISPTFPMTKARKEGKEDKWADAYFRHWTGKMSKLRVKCEKLCHLW